MNHLSKRILNLWFCCLFTQTILCSTPNISRSSEEFLSKLRSNIKLSKKYVEGKKPVEFTLLRVAGNDIDMTDLRKLNQRLGGRDEPEKQICIITLRNNCKSSSTNAENFMVRLIRGLQIHLNHNGNAVLLNEVGVRIDFIKEAYIADYDKITKTTSEFYGKFTKLEEIIIDNLYMISCDAFRDILHGIIFNFLCQDSHLSGDSHSYRDSISESLIKDKHHKMIEILKSTVCSDKLMESLSSKFWYKDTESFCLYQEICKYENDNDLNFFSEEIAFDMAYLYLLKYKYAKAFKKSTKQLIMSICNVLNLDNNIRSFTTYYIDLIDQYRAVYSILHNLISCSSQHEENIRSFCSEDYFIRKRNDFIDRLLTDEIKILYDQTQKTTKERLKQGLMAESVTRIFYDKKLTRKTVYQLCSILQNSNAFSDFCKHQLIYINSGNGIQKGEGHTLIDQYEAILSDFQSFDSVMEIKSTVQTLNENTKTTACQIFTYTRRKIAGKIETGSKYSDLTKKANGNLISIEKYTEPMGDTPRKEYIEKCIKKYVDGVENIIFESWVITVISEHNQSLIYMITYGKNDVSEERVLLIFDVPFADRPANYSDSRHSDRYIRCIEDAQEPVLHNLNDNLQALQLAACIKLHIPNVCCALAYDYTYTEKIFKKTGFYSPTKFLYEYIWSTQLTYDIHMLRDNLSIKEFLNRKHIRRCGTKHLSSILTKFGIEKQNFDNFLFDFITNKRSSGFGHIEPAVNDECSDCCKAGICYTLQENDVMTVYTYEIKKLSPKDCATIVPAALLCKMLEYQEFSCLLKALDLTQSYNCKTTFLTSLIDAICTKILEINCPPCSNRFILPEYWCEDIIIECITNHCECITNPSITGDGKSTEPSRLYQQAFDKLINQDDIKYLAKTIYQELQILSDVRVDVITSIRIDLKKLVPQSKLMRVISTLKKKLKL